MKKTKQISVMMQPGFHKKAAAKAEKMDVSLSHVVRQLLRKWLAEE